ncbi:hypothetical protein AOLI_G00015820 [Acnodon oligacanthus]
MSERVREDEPEACSWLEDALSGRRGLRVGRQRLTVMKELGEGETAQITQTPVPTAGSSLPATVLTPVCIDDYE